MKNGVKQGGVLLPMLFSIYIDELLMKMKKSGLGCYIGNVFIGALGYADDITILSPSIPGINEMLKTCEEFAQEYQVVLNEKKSAVIKFGKNSVKECHLVQNSQRVPWKNEVKHLGNIVASSFLFPNTICLCFWLKDKNAFSIGTSPTFECTSPAFFSRLRVRFCGDCQQTYLRSCDTYGGRLSCGLRC